MRKLNLMKTAIVTGSGGGLGSAICKELLSLGFQIIAIDIIPTKQLTSLLKNRNCHCIGGVDFSNRKSIEKSILKLFPNKDITVLINNAGISVGGKLLDETISDWQKMIDVNLTAPFILSQAFVKNCEQFHIQGSIVNISSMAGIVGAKKPGYAASKAGLLGLTKSIAMQTGPDIRCNAIYPGAILTPMTADWDEETKKKIVNNTPIGRIANPEEIAKIVAFLIDSEKSGYLTGTVINATGGQYLGQ